MSAIVLSEAALVLVIAIVSRCRASQLNRWQAIAYARRPGCVRLECEYDDEHERRLAEHEHAQAQQQQ